MSSRYESKLQTLVDHAWDQEIRWPQVVAWMKNFDGSAFDVAEERLYGIFALTRFMYFSKRLVREMLKSLYRDHFEAPQMQHIRRNYGNTRDVKLIRDTYNQALSKTRFIGVGNPAESGAHLLYYFRQVNYLPKDLFLDFFGAFEPVFDQKTGTIIYKARDEHVSRYVFFDDLVGSGTQGSRYLTQNLERVRSANDRLDLQFMSLFATTKGLEKMNEPKLFDGNAMCLFELDNTYKAFDESSRYFSHSPLWFDIKKLSKLAETYGTKLEPEQPMGYKDGQLLLGFTHNTPDNSLPIFWNEGYGVPWTPIFTRYDKKYGGTP